MQHDDENVKYDALVNMIDELLLSKKAATADLTDAKNRQEATIADLRTQLDTCRAELHAMTTEADSEKAAHTDEKAAHAVTKNDFAALQTTHEATKTELNTLQAAHEDLEVKNKVMVFLRNDTEVDGDTLERVRHICNAKIVVEENMTVEVLNFIGWKMLDHEIITIGGISYPKRGLFIKSLEIEPRNATAWYHLGAAMNILAVDETVTINNVPYTREECYRQAYEINPLVDNRQ